MFNGLQQTLTKTLAEKIDADIIYGCDDNAIRWHKSQMDIELRNSRHKRLPQFLWKRILKGIVIHNL